MNVLGAAAFIGVLARCVAMAGVRSPCRCRARRDPRVATFVAAIGFAEEGPVHTSSVLLVMSAFFPALLRLVSIFGICWRQGRARQC
jgi:hypothetical protein